MQSDTCLLPLNPSCFPFSHRVTVRAAWNKSEDLSCFFGRFKEIRPARPVVQVKLYDRTPSGEWYWVTGWSDDARSPGCQAHAQLVEDSGAGLTHLVYGGIYGLRFKPISTDEAWSLDSPHQWGEAYLSLSSERDLRYAEEPSATP